MFPKTIIYEQYYIFSDMVLTHAEKQKRYRQRLNADPERKKIAAEKERERWHRRKELGKVKLIGQMTEREQRYQRRKWRENYRNYKLKNKVTATVVSFTNDNASDVALSPVNKTSIASRQKQLGRKIMKRNRSASYRTINKLKKQLTSEKQKVTNYRKQLWRLRVKLEDSERKRKASKIEDKDEVLHTPRKRAKLFVNQSSRTAIEKELVFHFYICDQLREKYAVSRKNRKNMQILSKIFGSTSRMKKYRTITKARKEFGTSRKILRSNNQRKLSQFIYERKMYCAAVKDGTRRKVKAFFEQDNVSRATSGKKETVTRQKKKRQKRYLLQPLKVLHKQFITEYQKDKKMSISTFRRLKPFWIVKPRIQDRETCLCKLHENTRLMHSVLKHNGFLEEQSILDVVKSTVCDENSKDCCYRECPKCKDKCVVFLPENNKPLNLSWWEWKTVTENYKGKEIKKAVKKKNNGDLHMLKSTYAEHIAKISSHIFNINTQFSECKKKKESLNHNELFVHIDFAENWTCKRLTEIQSAHFGGSNAQITLHTGVAYIAGQTVPESFCGISDNNSHNPSAIWSHLNPVLQYFKRKFPELDILHFLSDGPVTQYRGRQNLHLMANVPFLLGFKEVYWNFSESGHGKGAPDGIGASVKQLADRVVLGGATIDNGQDMFNELQERTKVKLFYIPEDAETKVTLSIPAVRGILKVHQVYSKEPGKIKVRHVSCYCSENFCDCYAPMEHDVIDSVSRVTDFQNDSVTQTAQQEEFVLGICYCTCLDQHVIMYPNLYSVLIYSYILTLW